MQTNNASTFPPAGDRAVTAGSSASDNSVCAMLDAAEACRQRGRYAEAIGLGEAALATAAQANDGDLIALAQLELGTFHRYDGNPVAAIGLLHAAELHYRTQASPLLPRALVRQGLTWGDSGDQLRARGLYRDALALIELQGSQRDHLQEAACYEALGASCIALDDAEQAEHAYQRAIPLYGETGDWENICLIYRALASLRIRALQGLRAEGGELFASKQMAEQAFQFIEQGMRLNEAKTRSAAVRAALCNSRAELLRELGRDQEALDSTSDALAAYRELADPRGQAQALTALGETCLKLARIDAALAHLQSAQQLMIDRQAGDAGRRVHRLLAAAHECNGDAVQALRHYKEFHLLDIESQQRETQARLREFALRGEVENALSEAKQQRARRTDRAEKKIDRRSREDALTGVANRRMFDEWLTMLPAPAARAHAVAMLNIDHLGDIKDRFSPAAGNAVLREAGRILREQMRATDLVARYGSEEFVIVQAGISLARARETLERLRIAFETHDWSAIDPALRVTVSIGVAAAEGNTTRAALTACADQQLYAAKHAGRNRVL